MLSVPLMYTDKITELRTILQRESQHTSGERTTFGVKRSLITYIRGTDNIWCQKVTLKFQLYAYALCMYLFNIRLYGSNVIKE
jgi:hypothetical protein